MKTTAHTHGGRRPGSGREFVKDKKIGFRVSARMSELKAIGGIEAAQAVAYSAIIRAAKATLQKKVEKT